MPEIRWRHNRERLVLPVVIFPGYASDNPNESVRAEGLLDTGATGTGVRRDLAQRLNLRVKGQRRVYTANGMMMANEHVVRIGLICGDYQDPNFVPAAQLPYLLEKERVGFELQSGFAYEVLIGMDVLGEGNLSLWRDGTARLQID